MSPLFGRGRGRGGSAGGNGGDSDAERARTADERERARLEREARRARREGRSLPEVPQAPGDPVEPIAGPAPVPHPRFEERAPTADPVPDPAPLEPAHEPEAEAVYAHGSSGHWADPDPEPEREPDIDPDPEPEPDPDPEHAPTVRVIGASDEEPLGTRRVAASAMASAAGAQGPPRFGAPPKGRGRGPRRLRRILVGLVGLVPLLALAWAANAIWQPFKSASDAGAVVRLTIPSGSGTGAIGKLLAREGVVDSSFFFQVRARIEGDGGKLHSGSVTLRKNMTYAAALQALTAKSAGVVATTDVTVPEGRSIGETAAALRQSGPTGDYVRAAGRSRLLDPRAYGAPKGTTSREGFLWPATYQLKKGATVSALVADQLRAFKTNFAKVDLTRARTKKLSRYDVLIIASMIEREAEVPGDRRLIASVIYNRLKAGIPLGIDATLRYRLGNWTRPLKVSELNTSSAFNTRRSQGLPPTPIGNPGMASLQAAARPASTPYLYYVVKPCGNGAHAFSRTDAQFQRDVAAYNRKRAQLGGKDPSHC